VLHPYHQKNEPLIHQMTAFLKNSIKQKGQKHLSVSSFRQKQQQRNKNTNQQKHLSAMFYFTKQTTETTHASVYLTTHPPPKP